MCAKRLPPVIGARVSTSLASSLASHQRRFRDGDPLWRHPRAGRHRDLRCPRRGGLTERCPRCRILKESLIFR
jgi:hypothetical protein